MKTNKAELLRRVQNLKDQPGTFDVLCLLEEYVEEWKESLVIIRGEKVIELQGAISKVREILTDIRRDVKPSQYKNGAYNGEG